MSKKNLDEDFWENILRTNETKRELFGKSESRNVWCKASTAFHKKNTTPTLKHGSVMVWGCVCCKIVFDFSLNGKVPSLLTSRAWHGHVDARGAKSNQHGVPGTSLFGHFLAPSR